MIGSARDCLLGSIPLILSPREFCAVGEAPAPDEESPAASALTPATEDAETSGEPAPPPLPGRAP